MHTQSERVSGITRMAAGAASTSVRAYELVSNAKCLARKLFVFAGERVVLVLQFLDGGAQAGQLGLQALVVAAGSAQLHTQLVDATLHVAARALGRLQPLRHVTRARVRLPPTSQVEQVASRYRTDSESGIAAAT